MLYQNACLRTFEGTEETFKNRLSSQHINYENYDICSDTEESYGVSHLINLTCNMSMSVMQFNLNSDYSWKFIIYDDYDIYLDFSSPIEDTQLQGLAYAIHALRDSYEFYRSLNLDNKEICEILNSVLNNLFNKKYDTQLYLTR